MQPRSVECTTFSAAFSGEAAFVTSPIAKDIANTKRDPSKPAWLPTHDKSAGKNLRAAPALPILH